MADFLDEKRKEIQARLKELKPAVEEYQRLEAAEQALSGVGGSSRAASPAPATSARRRKRTDGVRATAAAAARAAAGRGPRRRSSWSRRRPGITIPELAEQMGIKQNYLYRVMPSLAEEGKVTKSGRGWHVRDGA